MLPGVPAFAPYRASCALTTYDSPFNLLLGSHYQHGELDVPYLDGSYHNPNAVPGTSRANEASHLGIQVRDRDRSLASCREPAGMEVVAEWLAETQSTRQVIGYPAASLDMAILRMSGTQSCFEVVEYRNVGGSPINTHNGSNGTAHIAYAEADLDRCCEDPDGIRVQFFENCNPD